MAWQLTRLKDAVVWSLVLVTLYSTTAGRVYAEQLFLREAVCTRNRNVMFAANIEMPHPT